MTLLSCLAIGVAFLLAVALLAFAGALIGLAIPRRVAFPLRRHPRRSRVSPADHPKAVDESHPDDARSHVDPPGTGG